MARSISPQELIGWWREDLDPYKHITAECRSEKLSLHLSQFMVLLYGLLCLSAINEAILLYTRRFCQVRGPAHKINELAGCQNAWTRAAAGVSMEKDDL